MDILIGEDFNLRTVKDWLYQHQISRKMITHLKTLPQGITLNGKHSTVRQLLHTGDILSLQCEDSAEDENEQLLPTELPLSILYENDELIAVNKPPNMPTHPSLGHYTDTLANSLAYYFSKKGIPFVFRAINRLDRDTSGVVLVAKNRHSAARLTALLQSGGIKKAYLAVLNHRLSPSSGELYAPIRRREEGRLLREVCAADAPGAKEAQTRYETLAASDEATLVRAEPITGRTHQLRVHFAHLGCPIVGDWLYGTAEASPTALDRCIERQALHAVSLTLSLPEGELRIEAPLPPDMQTLCDLIQKNQKESEMLWKK